MVTYTRKAADGDLDRIAAIFRQGREFLRAQGSPQWQNGTGPGRETAIEDMRSGAGYVLVCDGAVHGYGALVTGVDACYTAITDGAWAGNCDRYISIHRVALDPAIRGRGLAKALLHDLVVIARVMEYRDIRIDTYPANAIMERVILQTGFTYRGMIRFPIPHGERRAFQLLLD